MPATAVGTRFLTKRSRRFDPIHSRMSDCEILLRWLATVAGRLGWSRRIRELGQFACALVALCLLAEVVQILGAPAPVLYALAPLAAITALVLVALFAWRLARPTTLAQAAGAADTRADLKDQLKSAHWFAQRAAREPLVELLLNNAAKTAQRLDARRLFPFAAPRSALAALALAILTGFLGWFSPRIALPVMMESMSRPAAATSDRAGEVGIDADADAKIGANVPSPDVAAKQDLSDIWSKLEELTKELPAGAEEQAMKSAVAARDARLVAQLLAATLHQYAIGAQQDPATAGAQEEQAAAVAPGIRERLQQIMNRESKARPAPETNALAQPTAHVRQQLSEQIREEQRKLQGNPTEGEVTLNNRLRAVSRNSAKQREVAYAEGEAAEAGSQTSVDGVATGDRQGKSQSGGSEGEHPFSGPAGEGDKQPVLGERTERLEGQLQRMRVEDPQQREEEERYAATQRHAAKVGYESIEAHWRERREAAVTPGPMPLSYREAVKRYFLTEHDKEE